MLFLFRPSGHFCSELYFILPMGPRGKLIYIFILTYEHKTLHQLSNQKTVARYTSISYMY